jgi:hypothetical protein
VITPFRCSLLPRLSGAVTHGGQGVGIPLRFKLLYTLATELLGRGASFEDVADILGNSPEIVRKHYGKWSPARQTRIDDLMERVHIGSDYAISEKSLRVQ